MVPTNSLGGLGEPLDHLGCKKSRRGAKERKRRKTSETNGKRYRREVYSLLAPGAEVQPPVRGKAHPGHWIAKPSGPHASSEPTCFDINLFASICVDILATFRPPMSGKTDPKTKQKLPKTYPSLKRHLSWKMTGKSSKTKQQRETQNRRKCLD